MQRCEWYGMEKKKWTKGKEVDHNFFYHHRENGCDGDKKSILC